LGVVERTGNRMHAVSHEALKVPQARPVSECLQRIAEGVAAAIERDRPDVASIEGAFYCRNVKTAMRLGEARGAVIATCARHGIPVYEYPPSRVKQAVVGHGRAGKEQVQKMVCTLLACRDTMGDDESDALALAVCHLHTMSGHAALNPKPV
jgi:crossover junction endodeoxyribonuclease RuvC